MKTYKHIILLSTLAILASCANTNSELINWSTSEYEREADKCILKTEYEKAKRLYFQAINLDERNFRVRQKLIGVYAEQDSLHKAMDILEKMPEEQKNEAFYFQLKAGLLDYSGQKESSIKFYKKAIVLIDEPTVKNETNLFALIDYAMLETLAGQKRKAVNRLNESLKLNWLTDDSKRYIEDFRNEFEFYQGNGSHEFEPKRDLLILTTNSDSLELILRENHINISGSSTGARGDTTEIYLSEKFRKGLRQLNIKTYSNN